MTSVKHSGCTDIKVQGYYTRKIKHLTFRCKLTEIVCIDEFKASTIAGEYALIIGDPISGKILDILPSRKQDFISHKTIVESLFHQSIHIADRFHWISLATEAFNKTRINVMKKFERLFDNRHVDRFEEYIIVTKLLKSYYKFFLANTYNKEGWYFEEIINVKYLKQEMTITELIEYCLNKDEELKEAYFNL